MREKEIPTSRFRALDLFCGAGGSTCGAKAAGVDVVGAVDAWDLACMTYQKNHPGTRVYHTTCDKLDPAVVQRELGPIDFLLASPECTNHTCAKGAAVRCEDSKNTAFQVVRFAKRLRPRWIVIENVIQMRTWDRYRELLGNLEGEGYCCVPHVLNAVDSGVPQSRRRLFVVCQLGSAPPPVLFPVIHKRTVEEIVETNDTYRYSPLRTSRRATGTIARADRAIAEIGETLPFLIVYYGSDGSGGWQPVTAPLRTITTLDRFAYVRPRNGLHEMRMLQVPELKLAMGFPNDYLLDSGTRRDKIKLLGNAVCPPVMAQIITALVAQTRQRELVTASAFPALSRVGEADSKLLAHATP
jgi:DNA (cytosine-5)-methyltransferase 1